MKKLVPNVSQFSERSSLSPLIVGCILIGGSSSRMGYAKHLISREGRTWLQMTASTLAQVCDHVVVVGQGDMGECTLPRLSDVPGCSGPIAGLLSAMRSFPWSTIIACACDMPEISLDALNWLLQQQRSGRKAVIPYIDGRHEPLLALYDFRFFAAVEALASQQKWRLSSLAEIDGVYVAEPPPALRDAWRNVNTPDLLSQQDL